MDASYKDRHVAIYGTTKIERAFCQHCKRYALIMDGLIHCCNRLVGKTLSQLKQHRMCVAEKRRKSLGRKRKKEILEKQDYRCLYCQLRFGSLVYRKSKPIKLKINWDHKIPWVYSQDNQAANYAAACHICNAIKSDLYFGSVEDAQLYIQQRREEKGYSDMADDSLRSM